MRKLIFAINVSLDGCCDHSKFNPDDEVLGYFTRLTRDADVQVYGRKTYELMVPYWPDIAKDHSGNTKADIEYAEAFNALKKMIVCSRSLDKAEGKNTEIVSTNLQDTILQLKQEQGRDILVGGVDIPSQLIALGLVDEYRIVVHPIVVGAGRRLFDTMSLPHSIPLKLADSTVFKSGCVALRYAK